MEIIYRKPGPGLADRLAAVMSKCENVSKAFRDAGVQTATAYAIIAGDKPKPSVEITALRDICRALGCSLADLGVGDDEYLLFAGHEYHPSGGAEDYRQLIDGPLSEATKKAEEVANELYADWWQLAQLVDGKLNIVAQGGEYPY